MLNGELTAWHFATRHPVRIRWADGVITQIEPAAAPEEDCWLTPPIFDVQINGYAGVDFQQDDLTEAHLLQAARALRSDGCARFLLTLITADWGTLTARLRHLAALRAHSAELQAAIAGWHLEGPFLSPAPGFHGAHDPAFMLSPTPEHIRELRRLAGNDPLLLTLAPEVAGALAAIECATGLGIKVSLGHTNAPAEILAKAVRAGATLFTHLGNGCPRELDRHDNILWRVCETPGLTPSLIPDGIHVSPTPFRLMHRLLNDAVFYTTDAMAAAGAAPGQYTIGQVRVEVGADQIVRQPGRTNFAGSALRPAEGVFRAAKMLNGPWLEAWSRFSEVPARLMGLRYELAVGRRATFCLVRPASDLQPAQVTTVWNG